MSRTKNLVIVESPAKAKTIEKYLGGDFSVLSSVGHIRSIAKKTKEGKDGIDISAGFKTTYEIDPDKKKVVSDLKKATANADTIWLATDEDREGEAIAWHLCEVLKLDPAKTNRIVFHEITKPAIETAIKNPRKVDMKLVEAQQARQILDRIVGYELSPVVWQKVPGGKSAGRVQSPALRLVVEREREIEKFEDSFSFKITAEFFHPKGNFDAELNIKFDSEDKAKSLLESLVSADFLVDDVKKTPGKRNPSAPFTTSTLQQEASSRLGYSARSTMSAAQKLYQEGKITYMRTDSTTLSSQATSATAKYIEKTYGTDYLEIKNFKTKVANAQEAHEAIRPTDMSLTKASSDSSAQKIYELIRNRTIASQMKPAIIEKTTATITNTSSEYAFEAKGEVVIFDGFLAAYGRSKEDKILPGINSGDRLKLMSASAKQLFARPPARYTEGTLVKKLEELGIGRPSTYATIIGTILARGYVQKGESEGEERPVIMLTLTEGKITRRIINEKSGSNKGRLIPTPSGEVLSSFLSNHFQKIVDYNFTARIEKEFDQVAGGQLKRNEMLDDFYSPFHSLIEKSNKIDRKEVSQAREVGLDPKSGKVVIARYGRYGPMLQLGLADDDNKPEFAPMPKGAKIETVTLEQAVEAFKLPRTVGETSDGMTIQANTGRFGPYVKVGSMFVSIKDYDPHTITLDQAIELIDAKIAAEKAKIIKEFSSGLKILNGRFGPYVTDGKTNAKIDKSINPNDISENEATNMLAESSKKPKKSFQRRRKTK